MKTIQDRKFIITKFTFSALPVICGVYLDASNHPLQVYAQKEEADLRPFSNESVYVGKVKKILKEQGAFVQIAHQVNGYLPFSMEQTFFYVKKSKKDVPLSVDDEIVVQIKKQPIKTKEMVLSSAIDLHGDHMILLTDSREISVSAKIPKVKKEALKNLFLSHFKEKNDCGFLIRTNAADCADDVLLSEADHLYEKYLHFISHYKPHICFEQISKGKSRIEEILRPLNSAYTQIVTDQPDVFEELKSLCTMPLFAVYRDKISFYEDDYPLYKLYGLETIFSNLTKPIVWLNSGANIIIEQTEALTVIDVNSSKQATKKEVLLVEINKEAAKEIALQLRLRNISGIIIVDFINVKNQNEKAELLALLREETRYDTCRVNVLDYTKLGLVEMTREKKYPSLKEVLTS